MRGRKEAVYFTGIYMTYDLLVGALNKAGLPNLSSQSLAYFSGCLKYNYL